ncbi:MAG TPA: aromatic ring-hydroxylating dioxygenase subunit alpha [Gammaproteobacteria bacterium]|nr:aromatic ring-hydroxylating dioxygenase subunit alpha [Gammaproteobacteria bacterium]HIK70010.1 aromatic ring-hydroxylating dioxygenase subunit alpha [Pseudomonadales bacterium]
MTDTNTNKSNTNATLQSSLPVELYLDPVVYQEELRNVWYRQWLYVGRADQLPRPGDYILQTIGDQSIIVTRSEDGGIRAFHNTCRHRGSALCQTPQGQFTQGRIMCPYHRWSYSLNGELLSTPFLDLANESKNFSLYSVPCESWRGNIYLNLDTSSSVELGKTADPGFAVLNNWPLEQLKLGHSHQFELACNWKIFWENYLECYHCPGVHPELCKLVPLYQAALSTDRLDPDTELADAVASGIESWTTTGKAISSPFPDLSRAECDAGHTFMELYPSQYIVAHSDYIRQVSIIPLAADRTRISAEWLFSPEAMAKADFDPTPAIAFSKQVLAEDAMVNELNQQGITALPHQQGYLTPQEGDLALFHQRYKAWMNILD